MAINAKRDNEFERARGYISERWQVRKRRGIDVINLQPEKVVEETEESRNSTCRNGDSTNFLEILIVYCVHAENNQCSCSTQYVHFQISDQNFA